MVGLTARLLSLSPASKLLTVCKRPVLQTDERELRDVFGKYGEIKDVHLPTDRETGRLRGFAFLSYNDTRDCDDALAAMNGRVFPPASPAGIPPPRSLGRCESSVMRAPRR